MRQGKNNVITAKNADKKIQMLVFNDWYPLVNLSRFLSARYNHVR